MVIRDMAATVLGAVRTRKDHPSFGQTKANIRGLAERMEGAIGLYMVQSGQTMHPSVPVLAEFLSEDTTSRVAEVRAAMRVL
jgi:hypothetical protein